jgi:hypothetical protein
MNRERQDWVHSRVSYAADVCYPSVVRVRAAETSAHGRVAQVKVTGTCALRLFDAFPLLPPWSPFGARCFRLLFVSLTLRYKLDYLFRNSILFGLLVAAAPLQFRSSFIPSSFVQSLAHYRISVSWTSMQTSVVFGRA